MSLIETTRAVRASGYELFVADDVLQARVARKPMALMSAELKASIKSHKVELKEIYGCPVDPTLQLEIWIPSLLPNTTEAIEDFIDRQRMKPKRQRGVVSR